MHVAAGWNGSATLAFTGEATIIVKRRRPTIPHPFSSHHFTLEFSSPLRPRSCPAVDDDLAPSARSLGLKPPATRTARPLLKWIPIHWMRPKWHWCKSTRPGRFECLAGKLATEGQEGRLKQDCYGEPSQATLLSLSRSFITYSPSCFSLFLAVLATSVKY